MDLPASSVQRWLRHLGRERQQEGHHGPWQKPPQGQQKGREDKVELWKHETETRA